ncbi:MAG: tetratricopeptide repeat protein [Bacteroidetes bacterium]|nr:tetratricopeptide repeat protein [Bacteroidota bacterium]
MLQLNQKYMMLLFGLTVVCVLAVIGSCKKEPTAPEKDAPTWVQEGWQQFEAKRYTDALNSFNNALNLNPADSVAAIAYCGIGWSLGRLYNYDLAYNNFSFAIQRDSASPGPYVVHAYVGRTGVLHRKNLYNDAISDAMKALNLSGTYEFTHDRTIKFTDLHFLLAQAYYHTLQYTQAQGRVDFLRNLFALGSINWSARPVIVDGVSYATYHEALLKAIESLRGRV